MTRDRSIRHDLSRRGFVAGTAAGAAALAMAPRLACAQAAAHTLKVGAAEVVILSDGDMVAPLDFVLPTRSRAEVAQMFTSVGQTLGDLRLQYNVSLVRMGGETILIDTGSGPDFAPARGKLTDNLTKAGIAPESVTRVIFTHAHPDHLWGVVDPLDGGSMFPKARHYMAAVERDFWLKPGIETLVPETARGTALGTQRRLKELGDKIQAFKAGEEILPGIAAVDTSGHTPGHVGVLVSSGGSKLMVIGDALTEPVISFARPDWPWAPDLDQDKAIVSRKKLLDMLASERIGIVGYHLPWPGAGRVERHQSAYRFVLG